MELDPWVAVGQSEDACFSASVIDTFCVLFEILEFWSKLDWPGNSACPYLFRNAINLSRQREGECVREGESSIER